MHCNHANGGCGLPGVDEITGKKCEKLAELTAEKVLSRRGLIYCKGKMVIFTVSNHSENETNRTGSTKRRRGLWNHLIWSCG